MLDPIMFNSLRRFRAGVYGAFGARRDALFDLWMRRRSPGWCRRSPT